MRKVYLALENDWELREVRGIFTSFKKAKEYLKSIMLKKDKGKFAIGIYYLNGEKEFVATIYGNEI